MRWMNLVYLRVLMILFAIVVQTDLSTSQDSVTTLKISCDLSLARTQIGLSHDDEFRPSEKTAKGLHRGLVGFVDQAFMTEQVVRFDFGHNNNNSI